MICSIDKKDKIKGHLTLKYNRFHCLFTFSKSYLLHGFYQENEFEIHI